MKYRREIDGLRALAVIPVILYHAGFGLFSGGFVGVDVFFVISGYLITSIIVGELEAGDLSLANFYERRARRILPALFTVMLACVLMSWFVSMPDEMQGFSRSLAAQSVFASNILFWRESGYFDAASEIKPLLHTWSLSVEEQFYVFFPLFCLLVWRWSKGRLFAALAIVGAASFLLAAWASTAKPAAAFYLLPTRAWELALGALAALHLGKSSHRPFGRTTMEIAAASGLALILVPVFFYDKSTPFPGAYALAPTVGTLLVILFATANTHVGRLLGAGPLVLVGLISYSAYLWHQPLFAFARQRGLTDFDTSWLLLLSMLAMVLAYLTWKLVENPFRNRNLVSRKRIFAFALAGSLVFASFGLWANSRNGDIGQLSQEQARFLGNFENGTPAWNYFTRAGILEKYGNDCNFYDLSKLRAGAETLRPRDSIPDKCFAPGDPRSELVFLWGDSHAQQLRYGLGRILPKGYELLQVASSGCPPTIPSHPDLSNFCDYSNWFALEAMKRSKPRYVFMAQSEFRDASEVRSTAESLLKLGVGKVVVMGPSPHWSPTLPSVVARSLLPNVPRRTFKGIDRSILELDRELKKELSGEPDVRYISLIGYFCDARGCLVYFGDDPVSGLSSFDYGHLTPVASYAFARDVLGPQVLGR